MAVAVERRSQRGIDFRNQRADVVRARDAGLQDREFVAAEACDEIVSSDAVAAAATPP
jgi:hypothetical protein